jgi:hypothetical protein
MAVLLPVLQKPFGNLFPFGIAGKIGETKNPPLAGQGKFRIEKRPS